MNRSLPLAALSAALVFLTAPAGAADPAPGSVRRIAITTDKAPDCSSLKAIVASVTRGCKTNDEKAIALNNFMLMTHYHQNYPEEKGGVGALKELNVYGWSLCGGLHTVEASLWRELGWEWRYVGWSNPGHTTVECRYDDKWHYLDVFLRYYTWMPDPTAPHGRTIAGEDDIRANPSLVTKGLVLDRARGVYYQTGNRFELVGDRANWQAPAFLCCGDTPDSILTGVKSRNRAGSPTGWGPTNFDSPNYSTDVNLAPGHSLTLNWEPTPNAHWWNGRKYTPKHGCSDKDYRNCPVIGPLNEPYEKTPGQYRSFANGVLVLEPDLVSDGGFASVVNAKRDGGKLVPADSGKPAFVTVELQSPYILTRAKGVAEGADSVELSVDGGKTFTAVKLDDFSDAVGGQYRALVRIGFKTALRSLRLEAIVQCNRGALPYLSPGKNKVTVAVADAKELGANKLVVTYAYHTGFRSKSFEEMSAANAELGRAHYASWAKATTVVRKEFTAADLPATFEIDVPTPKGKYPIYPRMVFLRREVIAPGGTAPPLPANAVEASVGPKDELATLPNPFSIGTALPPKR
jgi:hypothetical protein